MRNEAEEKSELALREPFLLSLLHKGSLDIMLFFVIRKVFGLEYILWATPTMAAVALLVGIVLVLRLVRKASIKSPVFFGPKGVCKKGLCPGVHPHPFSPRKTQFSV